MDLAQEGSQCTLRAAIEEANRKSGKCTLNFAIPTSDPGFRANTGTFTLNIQSPLPDITEAVVIDATTQAGGRVEINGAGAGPNTDGLHFLAGDSSIRGVTIKGFGGNGLSFEIGSPSESELENNPHLYKINISDAEIRENCGWGIQAGGGVKIGYEGSSNTLSKINDNGHGAGCRAGGIFIHGPLGMNAMNFEIQRNNGAGILAEKDLLLTGNQTYPIKINYNQGYGIQAENGNVHLTGVAAHQIIGNKGKGIYAGSPMAVESYGYAGNIIIESGIEFRDNASWGVYGRGVSVGIIAGTPDGSEPVYIDNNGKGDESWIANIQGDYVILEKERCWKGGGIISYLGMDGGVAGGGGVKATGIGIRNNGGDGIKSQGDVTLLGGWIYPVKIMANLGAEIRTERKLTLKKGSVCNNGEENIMAGGGMDLQEVSYCENFNNFVEINNDASNTDTNTVSLTLTCINPSVCTEVMLCNDGLTWSAPEPYAMRKNWTLSDGDGTKAVFVKFRDNAGNWSMPYGDTINLNVVLFQYAYRVKGFSSQYSPSSWSAQQALGAPNTSSYGDHSTAWAPAPINGSHEYLILEFEWPVYADGVMIRETYGNGFVYQVDALDVNDNLQTVWTGIDPSLPGSPVDFEISFPKTSFLVKGVKIYVNTDHDLDAWEEIDAVQLRSSQANAQVFLIVENTGTGEGRIIDLASGIDCGESCVGLYDVGTVINLTSLAGEGSNFEGWQGACTGVGPCTFTITGNTTVTASFATQPPPCLRGDVEGNGTVGLEDAVLALKLAAGQMQIGELFSCADVNEGSKIGLEEVLL